MANTYYSNNISDVKLAAGSTQIDDLDIWEFTHCDHCMLPFEQSSSEQSRVPFWLTECGHVMCDSHICELFLIFELVLLLKTPW